MSKTPGRARAPKKTPTITPSAPTRYREALEAIYTAAEADAARATKRARRALERLAEEVRADLHAEAQARVDALRAKVERSKVGAASERARDWTDGLLDRLGLVRKARLA